MKKKFTSIILTVLIILLISIIAINIYLIVGQKFEKDKDLTPEEKIDIKTVDTLTIDEEDVIGYLKIDTIGLNAPIKDGTELSILKTAIGHFKESAYLTGNVCLAAHNSGYSNNFFENLKDIEKGAKVVYITRYEEKEYYVSEIKEIDETDLSVLRPTEENQLTLITCITNKREKRLCVIATERLKRNDDL